MAEKKAIRRKLLSYTDTPAELKNAVRRMKRMGATHLRSRVEYGGYALYGKLKTRK